MPPKKVKIMEIKPPRRPEPISSAPEDDVDTQQAAAAASSGDVSDSESVLTQPDNVSDAGDASSTAATAGDAAPAAEGASTGDKPKGKLSEYRQFVIDFMKKVDKSDERLKLGKDCMIKCGEEWQKHKRMKRALEGGDADEEGTAAPTSSTGSGRGRRHPVVFPPPVTSFRDVADIFCNVFGPQERGRQTFSRVPVFHVAPTKRNQCMLRRQLRNFQTRMKDGSVHSLGQAFTAGFNAFLDMARP